MKGEKDHTELIERYLDGGLKEKELAGFENESEVNPKLRKEVAMHKEIDKAIVEHDIDNFKLQISNIRQSMLTSSLDVTDNRPSKKYFGIHKYATKWPYAASVLILLGLLSVLYFSIKTPPSNKKLFAMYFQPYQAGALERSFDSSDSLFVSAMIAYNKNDFNRSSLLLKIIKTNDSNNSVVRLYLGISFLETGHAQEAAKEFEKIITAKDDIFREQAQWCLCLTYLKLTGNKNRVIFLLQEIINENGDSANQAQELLSKMKS